MILIFNKNNDFWKYLFIYDQLVFLTNPKEISNVYVGV
jgi:hypothetical protein